MSSKLNFSDKNWGFASVWHQNCKSDRDKRTIQDSTKRKMSVLSPHNLGLKWVSPYGMRSVCFKVELLRRRNFFMKFSCCTLLCCALLIPSCSTDLEVWKDNESEDDLSTIQWRSNDDNIFAKRSPITQNFLQFAEEKGLKACEISIPQ